MSYEMTGKIAAIYPEVQRTPTFKTREFVVEKTEEFNGRSITNYIKFQCVQDKTAMLNDLSDGADVKVKFNLKGSKWEKEGKVNYITNLDAWRIEKFVPGTDTASQREEYPETTTSEPVSDDLPF